MPNFFPKTHEGVKIPKLMFQKAPRAPRVSRMPEVHCFDRPYQYLWHYGRSGCILWVLKTPSAPQTPKTHSKLFSPTDASDCVLDCNQKYTSSENHYYKWFSILFWPLFTKSLSQESRVPSSNNTLFELLTYWQHVQMITGTFASTFLCALTSAPRSTSPF